MWLGCLRYLRNYANGAEPEPIATIRSLRFKRPAFAGQTYRMGLVMRTIGIARATIRIGMANLVYNFQRLAWLEGRVAPAWCEPMATEGKSGSQRCRRHGNRRKTPRTAGPNITQYDTNSDHAGVRPFFEVLKCFKEYGHRYKCSETALRFHGVVSVQHRA